MKMVARLQYTGEICNSGPRIVQSSSSLYSGVARLAPQIGHLSLGMFMQFYRFIWIIVDQ